MAHDKVYGHCENLCNVEVMAKEDIEAELAGKSNSNHNHDDTYKKIGDFAILTGTMSLSGNQDTSKQTNFTDKTLDYPTGFNKDNCVVLSIMRSGNNGKWSNGWTVTIDSMDMFNGIEPIEVTLHGTDSTQWNNKIRLRASNYSSNAITISYKIVLMKV